MKSELINELATALAKAQGKMKSASFDKTNPHYRNSYASLASITDAIKEPLANNGLSYSQTTEVRDGSFVLVTTLMHSSGQWLSSEYPLPVAAKPQELGSALTYARRYSLSAIACIAADEDDDAEGARTSEQTSSAPKPKPNAINPAPVGPVDPTPHKLAANDAVSWGQLFIGAVNMATSESDIAQWCLENGDKLTKLEAQAPKVFATVMAAVNAKRGKFQGEAA